MIKTSARPADEMEEVVHTYGNMLFRLCFVTLGNESDAQDALQEVFIKYMLKAPGFTSEEHKKAFGFSEGFLRYRHSKNPAVMIK